MPADMTAETPPPARWIRVWRGRTRPELFDKYAAYLFQHGVLKIRGIPGNLGAGMYRRREADCAVFTVISHWPDLETIKAFAGEDITLTRHLARDPEYLLELPRHVEHFEIFDIP